MPDPKPHHLMEAAYEAALHPGKWEDFSGLLQQAFHSPLAGLFVQNKWTQGFRRACLLGMAPAFERTYVERYASLNPWMQAGLLQPGTTIVETSYDRHLDRPGAYFETEFYNDWVKPQGFRYSMGGAVRTLGPDAVVFTVFRPPETGPFLGREIRLYEWLRTHIARAVDISARLEDLQWRVEAHEQLADRLPIGLVLLDAEGQVVSVNRKAEQWLAGGDPLRLQGKALAGRSPRHDDGLRRRVASALRFRIGGDPPDASPALLTSTDGTVRFSVTVVPLPRDTSPFGISEAAVAVFLSAPDQAPPLDRDRLRSTYGLTPTEARLAVELARRASLREAARGVGVTYETARGYLKTVLHKCGARTQNELIARLLSNWGLFVSAS